MQNFIKISLIILIGSILSYAQDNPTRLKIIGESLKGKVVDGQNVREVIGNVVITQEDVKITCNKAVQYISSNNAELIGNVVITQDSVVIKTDKGRYFGNIKLAFSDSTVNLTNKGMDLTADKGNYNLNTKVANFFGNVLFKDSTTNLNSNKLVYKKKDEIIIAVGNVQVKDTSSIVKADSLIHSRITKFSEGFGKVAIENPDNNLSIFGNYLWDNKEEKLSKISGNPFLIQIEKLNDGTYDTLFIKSKLMEARSDSGSSLFAIDSVKIVRGNFLSNNDYTIYNREKEQITILKQEEKKTPVLWYENSQIVGDSIYINLDSNKIKFVDIIKDAILISEDSTYEFRYNQISGDTIHLSFDSGKLNQTKVRGSVLSIYYLYEENEPNGLLKSSAKNITIEFENSKVTDVKMFGTPISEYHPENLVLNNEKSFTLPSFVIYADKPKKEEFKLKFAQQKFN
ncbi:MAG: LPS export ABC transporter periplasmic protein LptC [Ignavibacteriales bacterium]|nr:LPS export ABC transporter periplasmic protein LptC [Ignavibacteriales bacterium]MCB9219070.1 LPS export ABC transporter periplasmic protein LptC [Ignavibacteriales bacterium]